jgi:hypothetical protein
MLVIPHLRIEGELCKGGAGLSKMKARKTTS